MELGDIPHRAEAAIRETGVSPRNLFGGGDMQEDVYILTRGLQAWFTTPPPVKSRCVFVMRHRGRVWLDSTSEDTDAELLFDVSEKVFAECFRKAKSNV
jgi:hypothetical protein